MNALKMRPHHGMCLGFFAGEGYSGAFTGKMAQIQRQTRQNPEIELVCRADEICSACPNRIETGCRTQEQVLRYDREVLRLCGLREGERLKWNIFREIVGDKILRSGKREEICGDCEWSGLCRNSHRLNHNNLSEKS